MATKIIYRSSGSVCETACPFTDPQRRGNAVKVGSMACEQCECYVANDKKYSVLVCGHPGTPVFSRKDRAANKNYSI